MTVRSRTAAPRPWRQRRAGRPIARRNRPSIPPPALRCPAVCFSWNVLLCSNVTIPGPHQPIGGIAMNKLKLGMAAAAVLLALGCTGGSGQSPMTFFITSTGSGKGAGLGGLAGADAHCQHLAAAAGAGSRTWRAYLSTTAAGGQPAVNARDRIGKGPWQNAKGVVVAKNVGE